MCILIPSVFSGQRHKSSSTDFAGLLAPEQHVLFPLGVGAVSHLSPALAVLVLVCALVSAEAALLAVDVHVLLEGKETFDLISISSYLSIQAVKTKPNLVILAFPGFLPS